MGRPVTSRWTSRGAPRAPHSAACGSDASRGWCSIASSCERQYVSRFSSVERCSAASSLQIVEVAKVLAPHGDSVVAQLAPGDVLDVGSECRRRTTGAARPAPRAPRRASRRGRSRGRRSRRGRARPSAGRSRRAPPGAPRCRRSVGRRLVTATKSMSLPPWNSPSKPIEPWRYRPSSSPGSRASSIAAWAAQIVRTTSGSASRVGVATRSDGRAERRPGRQGLTQLGVRVDERAVDGRRQVVAARSPRR